MDKFMQIHINSFKQKNEGKKNAIPVISDHGVIDQSISETADFLGFVHSHLSSLHRMV